MQQPSEQCEVRWMVTNSAIIERRLAADCCPVFLLLFLLLGENPTPKRFPPLVFGANYPAFFAVEVRFPKKKRNIELLLQRFRCLYNSEREGQSLNPVVHEGHTQTFRPSSTL